VLERLDVLALQHAYGGLSPVDYYQPEDLKKIILRSARILKVKVEEGGAEEIARRARGTPRIANRLLRRVRDFAEVKGMAGLMKIAREALDRMEVDTLGLDDVDRKILQTIMENFGGGPVGINTIAAAIDEEKETIEAIYEPYLMRLGFLERTPRGRQLTPKAYEHLGFHPPSDRGQKKLF